MSAFGIGKTKAHYRIGLREGAVQNRQLADHGPHSEWLVPRLSIGRCWCRKAGPELRVMHQRRRELSVQMSKPLTAL